jgi:hypothetical protein
MVYNKEADHRRVRKSLHSSYEKKSECVKRLTEKLNTKGKLTEKEEIRLEKCKSEINTMRMFL